MVMKAHECLNVPVITVIKHANFFNVLIRLFCNNSLNLLVYTDSSMDANTGL